MSPAQRLLAVPLHRVTQLFTSSRQIKNGRDKTMAVADVVESMASHRPYRPALGVDAALEEIEQHKGILYDPAVVAACIRLFRENGFELG
jgi:hypothetical protein